MTTPMGVEIYMERGRNLDILQNGIGRPLGGPQLRARRSGARSETRKKP